VKSASKRKNLLLIVLSLLVALLAACGGNNAAKPESSSKSSDKEETLTFSMGVSPWVGYAPWWISAEQGIFEKYGLHVNLINFIQDADMNAAFASGNIKVANVGTNTAIRMAANNHLDFKGIILLDEATEADAIITTGDIQSVADLKGKTVAFEEGATSDLLLRKALNDNNMSIDDINVVYMAASDAGFALLSGDVDVAVTYEPYISAVKAKFDVTTLYSGADAPGIISDIAIVKSDYLAEHPDLQEKLQQVWDETMEYWKNNQEIGNEIVARNAGIDLEELPIILEGLSFYTSKEQAAVAESGQFLETAQEMQEIMLEQKAMDEEIDLTKYFHLQ
jgi:NitT/TauT family transport system substrate-binding protein